MTPMSTDKTQIAFFDLAKRQASHEVEAPSPAWPQMDADKADRRYSADNAGTQMTPMNKDRTQMAFLHLAKAPSFARHGGAVTGLLPATIHLQ
jgi:hypothetical protein